ncbi:MAG: hypothetical protein R3C14_01775 [Caldilineaceae bacterium]
MSGLEKTLVIWWRFGKEHGEDDGLRVNPEAVIAHHLDAKAARSRALPAGQWRGAGNVIVERPPLSSHYGLETRIYYLVERGLTVIEGIQLPPPREQWYWYLHVADIFYDQQRLCWVSQDLFCDIVLDPAGQRYHLMDLGDLGEALTIGLIDQPWAVNILKRTDQTLQAINEEGFPFPEIEQARLLCRQVGW